MPPPERTLFVVNPKSAGGRTKKAWPGIEKIAREKLGVVSTRMTEGPGHATELTRKGISEGYDLIVSVGGDGTNNEVVNGFFEPDGSAVSGDVAFGFLPRGTGCDLARTFELSDDPADAIRRMATNDHMIDIGRIDFTDHRDNQATRFFINVSGFGASGDVVARVNKSGKKLGGFATFALATVSSLMSYRNRSVTYSFDDGEETTTLINTIFVCNARYAGGGMIVGPKADMHDGLFDYTIVGDVGKISAIGQGPLLYQGRIYEHKEVTHARAARLKARSIDRDPVLIDCDGEQPGRLPAVFSCMPGALRIRA